MAHFITDERTKPAILWHRLQSVKTSVCEDSDSMCRQQSTLAKSVPQARLHLSYEVRQGRSMVCPAAPVPLCRARRSL